MYLIRIENPVLVLPYQNHLFKEYLTCNGYSTDSAPAFQLTAFSSHLDGMRND
jgi:hypothetical protein